MSKAYVYNPREYFWKVTLTGLVAAAVLVVSAYMIVTRSDLRILFAFVALVAGYTVLNTFVVRTYPSQIILEEDGISFHAYGRTTKYRFDEINSFLVKDWRGSGRMYIRINDSNMLRGRYWLYLRRCNDGDELFLYLLKLEYKTHPTSWKAKAWDSTRPNEDKTPILPWRLPKEEKEEIDTGETIHIEN